MPTTVYDCPLCTEFHAPSYQLLLPHIRLVHSTKPGFCITCSLDGCQRTFTNMKTYTNHIYGFHLFSRTPPLLAPVLERSNDASSDSDSDDDASRGGDSNDEFEVNDDNTESCLPEPTLESQMQGFQEEMKSHAATWILKTKEGHKLTQTTVDEIIQDVTALNQYILGKVYIAVQTALKEADISDSRITALSKIFNPDGPFGKPFRGLETAYKQLQYCKANLGMVEPQSIVLGTQRKWTGCGENRTYKTVEEKMVYIPVLDTLRTLLESDPVMTEVSKGHTSPSGLLEDYCDGQVYKKHSLYKDHPNALQINLYYDDVEVCNPLGSKRKIHKLGFFYFLLGNLPPWMRSKIHSVQVVAIVKNSYIKNYSMRAVLSPLVDDLKKLELGHELVLRKVPKTIYGTITAVSADNPASSSVGGFKEGSTAHRFCRQCLTTHREIKSKAHEQQCTLRTPEDYEWQCAEIEDDPSLSVEYGINSPCILNELQHFHCVGSLLPDIMHDVLEGVLPYEAKIMLQKFVQEDRYFPLDDLICKIENFELGYSESANRPTPITFQTLTSDGNSLKQNATQMWLLGRYLPLMIGAEIPADDEHWKSFTLLLRIMQYLFAPKLSEDDLAILQEMIMDHHHQFLSLYPAHSVTPKLHYLLHMPRLINEFGPLVHHWTMRYEAKHKYFKQLASTIGNFINLPYTLAMRHQFLQCYLRLGNVHSQTPETGKGVNMSTSNLPHLLQFHGSDIYCPRWVTVYGVTYKKSAVMVVSPATAFAEPTFSQIQEVFVIDSKDVYLYVQVLNTEEYNHHFAAYIARHTQVFKLIPLNQFVSYLPLHTHKISSFPAAVCIVPKFITK